MEISNRLSTEFKQNLDNVINVINLLDDGNTVPFIARYRKEMTGSMDDQVIRELSERLVYLRNLDKRKIEIKDSIEEQGKLDDDIISLIENAQTLSEIEDIYRPFRPKRKTRASIARSRGLEPLAKLIFEQDLSLDPLKAAEEYINPENMIETKEDALAGARDIIAEDISDNAQFRKKIRRAVYLYGKIKSSKTKDEDSVYSMYYEYEEPVNKIQSHRVLALNRGEKEEFLNVSIVVSKDETIKPILDEVIKNDSLCAKEVTFAINDSYDRLIFPSIEREIRNQLTDDANEKSIKTFSMNLKPLLMQPPVKDYVILGLDPAYRTGCKIAVIDKTGKVLDTAVVYPTPPHNKIKEAEEKLSLLIKKHNVKVISIGNGTASRESEKFVADLIKGTDLSYMIVSEAGASVYSASKLAAAEFPEYDVSLRSAVSIARRLQDPLAELVKIDPKSIGVGQYQHDMPGAQLETALSDVVEDCVNAVGVDLNTASVSLLSYVAGINSGIAKNIVAYREENGMFKTRKELLKVAKLGKKAFEQCAGFIRIPESDNILENTGVHPESYDAVIKLLEICGYVTDDIKNNNIFDINDRIQKLTKEKTAQYCGIGIPTLTDIIAELLKPGRDPRDELPPPLLRSDVLSLEDLKTGMELTGTVRNIVDFGAFVDIGVHSDGLVHISKITDRYIRHPSEVLNTGDIVKVWVTDIQAEKHRISLTMIKPQ